MDQTRTLNMVFEFVIVCSVWVGGQGVCELYPEHMGKEVCCDRSLKQSFQLFDISSCIAS